MEEPGTKFDETKCAACKQPINPAAILCPECGSYQSRFRRNLHYVARVFVVFAGVAAALVYVVERYPDIKRALVPTVDARAFNYYSPLGLGITNRGDVPIFVTHIFVLVEAHSVGKSFTHTEDINATLAPGEIRYAGKGVRDESFSVITGAETEDDWQAYLAAAIDIENECYHLGLLTRDSAVLHQWSKHPRGQELRTVDGTGELHYYEAQTGERYVKKFAIVGAVLRDNSGNCKSSG